MFGMEYEAHQQVIGDLSPPYDGSEMDLFPDLSFLDSVQSDFLNTGFDELAETEVNAASTSSDQANECEDTGEATSNTQQGIVSPSNNPTLMTTSSTKGKSVIKVIVNSSKDETALVKYLMGKDLKNGVTPKLKIIKKMAAESSQQIQKCVIDDVTRPATSCQDMKVDSTKLFKKYVTTSNKFKKSKKSSEVSMIEQLEKELLVCDPVNRNAIAARLNRLRKKNHVESLQETVNNLQTENAELLQQNNCLNSRVSSLETEVSYLKGILANQSSLSSLLSNIQATNLNFHTSMDLIHKIPEEDIDSVFQSKSDDEDVDVVSLSDEKPSQSRKRSRTQDNSVEKKKIKTFVQEGDEEQRRSVRLNGKKQASLKIQPAAGVCLHVSGKNVSLEFCSHCSRQAQSTIQTTSSSKIV
ncbi:uncharacterized protein [Antedon mediterranea]|uniref:uncharacterized protein n=1 Tax=Antedon mediterranea TaxID=105859 RepID=UPI003AF63B01